MGTVGGVGKGRKDASHCVEPYGISGPPPARPWAPGTGEEWRPLEGRARFRSIDACEREEWTIATWRKDGTGEPVISPLLCGSWRCRRCGRWRGAVDWARIAKGVQSRPWWLYVVVTFDPAECADRWTAFRRAGELWDHRLRRSIERRLEDFAGTLFPPAEDRLEYVQTWERHRNGWPHANVLLTSQRLRALVEAWGVLEREHGKNGRTCQFPKRFRSWLRERAMAAGFGRSIWVEVIDTSDGGAAMANYLLKLAVELTGAPNKKGNQSPVNAPRHFRRIRASRNLLPSPRAKSGEWTGELLRAPYARELLTLEGKEPRGLRETGRPREGLEVPRGQVEEWLTLQAREQARRWALAPSLKVEVENPIMRAFPRLEDLRKSLENGEW